MHFVESLSQHLLDGRISSDVVIGCVSHFPSALVPPLCLRLCSLGPL